jgi:hypothetical protein
LRGRACCSRFGRSQCGHEKRVGGTLPEEFTQTMPGERSAQPGEQFKVCAWGGGDEKQEAIHRFTILRRDLKRQWF